MQTIAIADAVMSLDNVLAIVGVARDDTVLALLGLAISIPLIVVGASLITTLINRFPVLIWIGAGLLGWVAGEMLVDDPVILNWLNANAPQYVHPEAERSGRASGSSRSPRSITGRRRSGCCSFSWSGS